ncbi:MAG TPA: class I SAM-dependent methyltransferase [Gammaproteobacteria bacterium]|nr:class I SAM-dependent methyltransferase [Gammaproteobacteria bacterium]
MAFADHFAPVAADYGRHRPGYPPGLFAFLADTAPGTRRAWDCATGTGQAARGLAEHFAEVRATDASAGQVEQAEGPTNVRYSVAPAEAGGLDDASADLVTVAQALHWFDLPAFYAEVRRVLRPGGLLAVWSYNLLEAGPAVDAVIERLYRDRLGPYWPTERRHVENGYRDLPFPFRPVAAPAFAMTSEWTLAGLTGYLGTWSAVARCREAEGTDPVAEVEAALAAAWGPADTARPVRWPLTLRVGRV